MRSSPRNEIPGRKADGKWVVRFLVGWQRQLGGLSTGRLPGGGGLLVAAGLASPTRLAAPGSTQPARTRSATTAINSAMRLRAAGEKLFIRNPVLSEDLVVQAVVNSWSSREGEGVACSVEANLFVDNLPIRMCRNVLLPI